jgi:type IV secretion system protein VirB10
MSARETSIDQEQKAIARELRLRGSAPPVARVSRKALIVVGGVLSASLAGALGWSLSEHPKKAAPEPVYQPASPPEKITALPKDYLSRSAPPALGPPLPGDLGRPIVSAQARTDLGEGALHDPVAGGGEQARRGDPADRAWRVEHAGARSSALFLAPGPRRADATPELGSSAPATEAAVVDDPRSTSPERLRAPASPYVLQAGAVIAAALVTGLTSETQGLAIAQVTQDVHDSLGGAHLLIPAGARLIGEYATATFDGQNRLAVAWTRLILPSGRSIILDKLPVADPQGLGGLKDGVDRHWRRVWAAAALSTVLSVGTEAGASDEDDLSRVIRRGVGQGAADVGQQAVGRSLALTPTLTIRAGAPLRVLLSRDLVLEPYDQEKRP